MGPAQEPHSTKDSALSDISAAITPTVPELAKGVHFEYRLIEGDKPSELFRGILDELDIRNGDGTPIWEGALSDILERLEDLFIRNADDVFALKTGDRFEEIGHEFIEELTIQLHKDHLIHREYVKRRTELSLLTELNLIEAVEPVLPRVDILGFLNATALRLVEQVDFVSAQWAEEKINAKEILLIGNERSILPADTRWLIDHYDVSPSESKGDIPTFISQVNMRAATDSELPFVTIDPEQAVSERIRFSPTEFTKWYIDNLSENAPDSWKGEDGIAQPIKPPKLGVDEKPSIAKTLASLTAPDEPKDVVFVSNQPFVPRQGVNSLYTLLQNNWQLNSFSTIGPRMMKLTDLGAILKQVTEQLRGEAKLLGYVR